jgi:hypothetical protein
MDAGTSLGRGTVARIGPPTARIGPRLFNREDNTALGAGDGGRIDIVPLIDAARAIDLPLSDNDNDALLLFLISLFRLVPRGPLRELCRREEDTATNPDEREVADMIGCCCCC